MDREQWLIHLYFITSLLMMPLVFSTYFGHPPEVGFLVSCLMFGLLAAFYVDKDES